MLKPAPPLLDVDGLTVDFRLPNGTLRAIEDVGFILRRGETLCIVGESGSGKSVTGRALMQLIAENGCITSGRIAFERNDGTVVDIARLPRHGSQMRAIRGADIGMIFQEPMSSLSQVHTIGEQVAEVFRVHEGLSRRASRERAIEALARVRIPDPSRTADRYPFEYSGGMRQRAMIAMALACSPRLLIADEPTTALDVTTQADILDLLAELQADTGMAVLFVTHDIGVVAEIAETIMVMRAGRVVESGPARDVLTSPRQSYSRALIGAARMLGRRSAGKPPPTSDVAPVVLRLADIGVHFPSGARSKEAAFRAVDGVNLEVRRGEALGIVGESGSGKTTLAKTIVRLIDPTTGGITFTPANGSPPVEIGSADRAQLGLARAKVRFVFQDPYASLNPRMTVRDALAEPLRMHGVYPTGGLDAHLGGLLESVGMPADALSRYPHAFSGGQRQRICIARALALRPEVIVADEATAALDVSLRAQVLDLFIDLQRREGMTFVFISHDMGVVRYFCDRVAVMRRGKVVEFGPVDEICETPQHEYTQTLLASVPTGDPLRPSARAVCRRSALLPAGAL